jgi:hypothetical protein
MAVGRISGPLLKDNLQRNGVNLAFETSLLYLDVVNSRVGINTTTPTNDLTVNGTTRTTNIYASNSAQLGLLTFSGSTVSSNNSTITFTPTGPNATVYQGTALVGNLSLTGNVIASTNTNGDINVTPNGTGQINLNANTLVSGNLHATGSITADGNIVLGDAVTDTITFAGEINSNILPATTNTYNLGQGVGPAQLATVITAGTGYVNGSVVTPTGGTGSATTFTLTATANGQLTVAGSPTGTAIGIAFSYTLVTQLSTSGTGIGAQFTIGKTGTGTNYSGVTTITVTTPGSGYAASDTIVIAGASLGGTTPAQNLTITVTTITGGLVTAVTVATPGTGYTLNDVLTLPGGSGATIRLTQVGSLFWNNVYANTLNAVNLSVTNVNAVDFKTAGLDITGNTISAINTNTDINLATTGTGGIQIGNLKFVGNTVTNTVANAVTTFQQATGTASFTGVITSTTGAIFTASITGNTLTVSTVPSNAFGGSLGFNGTNQYLTFSPGMQFASTAYTFECSFYQTGASGSGQAALIGSTSTGGYAVSTVGTTGIRVTSTAGGNNLYTATLPYNTWHHVAVTRNSSGVETVFINGTRSSTGTITNNTNYTGYTNYVGVQQGLTWLFPGQITNLRITTSSNVYDPTASTITIPVGQLPSITNTKLLLLASTSTSILTDTSGIQTVTQGGGSNVSYSNTSPFGTGNTGISIGSVITGSGVSTGSYVVSNISGTGTSASSSWTLNTTQTVNSQPITSTPVTMTVSGTVTGTIANGMALSGSGVASGAFITSTNAENNVLTGTGATGTYFVSPVQTVSSTTITGTTSGTVKFAGTYGVVVPVGTTAQRPSVVYSETGMIRYNTDLQLVEVFNAAGAWQSVAGSSGGVTFSVATDIALGIVISLG